ncbi:hypothetical protein CB1_000850040 [Camelus ferus]|nr:hypothetical protein CB1_000850040 [Camelus ferus]
MANVESQKVDWKDKGTVLVFDARSVSFPGCTVRSKESFPLSSVLKHQKLTAERYIFGIPPLILVLLPVASSDCDIGGKDGRVYQNVLMISIDDLKAAYLLRIRGNNRNSSSNSDAIHKANCGSSA